MSMLAERKRKQKWSLNPRGKEWSQDANKFGQKMLEKMGWQSGKGLGLKENGITEHIKVSFKNDSKGMGYKDTNDQWTEHETNFSALLESLTGDENITTSKKVSSLEQKSQASRARVHYHKFTRGKDLSRYSEKDLANIFGRKTLQETKEKELDKEPQVDSKEEGQASEFLVNGGSMMDYFKKKLPKLGKTNGYHVGNNGVLQKSNSDSESEIKPSFGFGFKAQDENNSESENDVKTSFGFGFNLSNSKAHKENPVTENVTKKESSKQSFVSYISEDSSNKRPGDDIEDSVLSPKKKVKKNKKLKIEENSGISNPAFNPMSTPVKIQKHVLDTIEENITEDVDESMCETLNKKNNKLNMSDSLELSESNKKKKSTGEYSQAEENTPEVSTDRIKKKKKSKRKKVTEDVGCEENPAIETNYYETDQFEKGTNKIEKSIDNPVFDGTEDVSINISQIEENPYEVPCKKLKKKKIKTKGEKNIDNPVFNSTVDTFSNSQISVESSIEVNAKKLKTFEIINPNFDDTEETSIDVSQMHENPYEVKSTEKKKKKKKDKGSLSESTFENNTLETINPYEVKPKKKKRKKEETGITNPALDLNNTKDEENTVIEDCDLMLNIVCTPVQQEQNNTSSVGSISKTDSVKKRKSVRFSNTTQELIIPNNDDLKEMYGKKDKIKKKNKGLVNINFDSQKISLDENIDTMAKTLDNYQAEVENDINEEKIKVTTTEDFMVGEVGNLDGENEQTKDGTKLKFKYANLDTKTPYYMMQSVGARKSYKHLIKGDILVKFKNTNLHEINGYGIKKSNKV